MSVCLLMFICLCQYGPTAANLQSKLAEQTRSCRFVAMGPASSLAGDIDRLLQANSGSATLSADVGG